MKTFYIVLLGIIGLGFFIQSCDNSKTYAELKEDEREAIRRFIELKNIKLTFY